MLRTVGNKTKRAHLRKNRRINSLIPGYTDAYLIFFT